MDFLGSVLVTRGALQQMREASKPRKFVLLVSELGCFRCSMAICDDENTAARYVNT